MKEVVFETKEDKTLVYLPEKCIGCATCTMICAQRYAPQARWKAFRRDGGKSGACRDTGRGEQGCTVEYGSSAFKKDRDDACGVCEETESVYIFRRGKGCINNF